MKFDKFITEQELTFDMGADISGSGKFQQVKADWIVYFGKEMKYYKGKKVKPLVYNFSTDYDFNRAAAALAGIKKDWERQLATFTDSSDAGSKIADDNFKHKEKNKITW